jgi:hypothetical protein
MRYPHKLADSIINDCIVFIDKWEKQHNPEQTTNNMTAIIALPAKKQKKQKPPEPADEAASDPPSSSPTPREVQIKQEPDNVDRIPLGRRGPIKAADKDGNISVSDEGAWPDDTPLAELLPEQDKQEISAAARPQPKNEQAADIDLEDPAPIMPTKPGQLHILGLGIRTALKKLHSLENE